MQGTEMNLCAASIARLHASASRLKKPAIFMEVCGTHTVNAFRCGLHSLMPSNVKLLSGPGCPVCVTAQGDIDQLIDLGTHADVTLCTYGDMLRVTGRSGSLELARSEGADVRVVFSSMDAVRLASEERSRHVVFAAVGFETTAPATAAAVLQAERMGLTNFTVLTSHKLVLPAMLSLLESRKTRLDGFLCPGHVAVITGASLFQPIVDRFHLPCVIAGFEDAQIAASLAQLTTMVADGEAALENLYPEAVTAQGNRMAMKLMEQVFEPADVPWRALGVLAQSGLVLRSRYALFDARIRFNLKYTEAPEPTGCRCGEVITGRCAPPECPLFGTACTPINAVGPCMVSSEGTCHAWFKYQRQARPEGRAAMGRRAAEVLRL